MVLIVLKTVFLHVRYIIGSIGVALAVLSVALLLPNKEVLWQVFSSSAVTLVVKLNLLLSLYGSLFTNYSFFSISSLVITAVLFGINVAFLAYYIRRRQQKAKNTSTHLASIGGLISAALGIGCAACGSIVLTAALGLFGSGGLILLLPLHGSEFGVLGIILLLWSINNLANRINDPLVCPLDL